MPTTKIHMKKDLVYDDKADDGSCIEAVRVILHHPDGKVEVAPGIEILGPSRVVVRPEDPLVYDGDTIGCWVETEAEIRVTDETAPAAVTVVEGSP